MRKLLYFYPENDLALADNTPNYTAPRAAVEMRQSGEQLPLWFGNEGDMVFTTGTNARWYEAVTGAFDIRPTLWDRSRELTPAPWGWSPAVCRFFQRNGFSDSVLPTSEQIECMRNLSHRSFGVRLSESLHNDFGKAICRPAIEMCKMDDIHDFINRNGRTLVKLPWSGSGRGLIDTELVPEPEFSRRTLGSINRQGSVIVEKYYQTHFDFAMLYNIESSEAQFVGYSLFDTDSRGAYIGNIVASDDVLEDIIARHIDRSLLNDVATRCKSLLEQMIGDGYSGPLGVDLMAVDNSLAVAEVNMRNTMGHVAHALASRYVNEGVMAKFMVVPSDNSPVNLPQNAVIKNGRLSQGVVDLTPGDRRFRFLLKA